MVSADYWLADYPEMRRTTQPSTKGGLLGEPGFCIFCSTGETAETVYRLCVKPFGIWNRLGENLVLIKILSSLLPNGSTWVTPNKEQ